MSLPTNLLRVTFFLLAAGLLTAPVRCEESKLEPATVVAELKKYDCRETNNDSFTIATKRLTFGCHSNLPDSAFPKLVAFPELEKLSFISNKVTDACLAHLRNLPKLTTLHINSSTITDEGMKLLKDLPKLEELLLMRTKVTDKGLAKVQTLPGLKRLSLIRLKVTPELIEQLKRFKHLNRVSISQTNFTDQQKRELTEALPNLSIR